jgi:hypothetical protein
MVYSCGLSEHFIAEVVQASYLDNIGLPVGQLPVVM